MSKDSIQLLLVQESRTQARLITKMIEETEGPDPVSVTHVTNLQDALTTLSGEGADVVLLSLYLPDANGLEGLEKVVRAMPEVPVIVFTSTDDLKIALKAVEAGAQDYLVKGHTSGDTILRSLRYAVERQRIFTELKAKKELIEKEKLRMEQELKMARAVQQQVLPKKTPQIPGLLVHGRLETAKEVGGDFYDFVETRGETGPTHWLAIGDVSGKGVGAGLVMVMAISAIQHAATRARNTHEALVEVNRVLKASTTREMFVSMTLILWDEAAGTVRYTSAGFEKPLLYRKRSQAVEVIETGGMVLGVMPDARALIKEESLVLEPGDVVLLYSDGVTEARSPQLENFGLERLQDSLHKMGHLPPEELVETIVTRVHDFAQGTVQHDDITLLALKRAD